jgi:hypothetical protein
MKSCCNGAETRIELATNSLEDCGSIENKDNLRPWRSIPTIKNAAIPPLLFPSLLNAVSAVTKVICASKLSFRSLYAKVSPTPAARAGGFGYNRWRQQN